MLKVRLLGAFDVRRDGTAVTISSRSAQTLFAYLILNAGTSFRREKLAGLLWPESNEENARDYLRHGLWRLGKAIGPLPLRAKQSPYIIADDLSVRFNESLPYSLDALILEKTPMVHTSANGLMEALALYEGELLPGFYDEWIVLEREHLQALYEQKMAHLLLDHLQEQARWDEVITWGERWISFGQKPEPAYRALMSAHAAHGNMSKVAATFERCSKSLREYGVEPSEQTRELFEKLKSSEKSAKAASIHAKDVVRQTAVKKIRVLISDDHALFREGLRALLNATPDIEVVGEAADGEAAIMQVPGLQPDVILMDIHMPGINGIEATRRILDTRPGMGIIMVTMLEDDASVFAAMKAGARGYVLKGAHHDDILQAIHTVAGGQTVLGPAIAARIMTFFQNLKGTSKPVVSSDILPELTDPERDVLRLMAQGANNKDIARKLGVSGKTVSTRISNIFRKLQVVDRTQAVNRARLAGLGKAHVSKNR